LTLLVSRWLAPVPLSSSPSFNPVLDTSVIVATIDGGETLAMALLTWLATNPLEIIIITTQENLSFVQDKISYTLEGLSLNTTKVVVLSIPEASKRRQMARGIEEALGSIIVLTDDDVFWPPKILPLILACFKDSRVGGVGTTQRGDFSLEKVPSIWAYLADRRLQRRSIRCAMINYCDASVTCLSGRTAAYRSQILKDPSFLYHFTHDLWLGYFLLDSGDDTFVTRWLLLAGWEIKMQVDPKAEITTPALQSPLFFRQLLRWSRNSKRSFLRCVFTLPKMWR
jgi:cellulose synthase/poly-beta-1,6-N-acetylglucosamine synthase-like glycosyltransferase